MEKEQSSKKEQLFAMFSNFLKYYSKKIYLEGYQNEDIIQEGYIALCNAYEKYDERVNSSFYFYGRKAIINRYLELIRKRCNNNYEISIFSNSEICIKGLYKKSLDYSLENEIMARIDSRILKNAINNMPKEHRDLIINIYWKNTKITRYSVTKNVPYKTCIKLHNKIKKQCLNDIINTELNKFYL